MISLGELNSVFQEDIISEADLEALDEDSLITRLIQRMDVEPSVSRLGSDYLHVSQLQDICPREHVLASQDGGNFFRRSGVSDSITFGIGRFVEEQARAKFIKSYGGDKIIGADYYHNQEEDILIYKEILLRDEEYKIQGHPDLLYYNRHNEVVILEIKSINRAEFEELVNPLANHLFQAFSYRRLAYKQYGFRMANYVKVFYVCKDHKFIGTPYKEFTVYHDRFIKNSLDRSWAYALQVKQARESGVLPPRVLCNSCDDTRAKNCPLVVNCFSRRR